MTDIVSRRPSDVISTKKEITRRPSDVRIVEGEQASEYREGDKLLEQLTSRSVEEKLIVQRMTFDKGSSVVKLSSLLPKIDKASGYLHKTLLHKDTYVGMPLARLNVTSLVHEDVFKEKGKVQLEMAIVDRRFQGEPVRTHTFSVELLPKQDVLLYMTHCVAMADADLMTLELRLLVNERQFQPVRKGVSASQIIFQSLVQYSGAAYYYPPLEVNVVRLPFDDNPINSNIMQIKHGNADLRRFKGTLKDAFEQANHSGLNLVRNDEILISNPTCGGLTLSTPEGDRQIQVNSGDTVRRLRSTLGDRQAYHVVDPNTGHALPGSARIDNRKQLILRNL